MYLQTRLKAFLVGFVLSFIVGFANAAAIPLELAQTGMTLSPDGYQLLHQTWKEFKDPTDASGKVFRVYDAPQSVNELYEAKRELQKRDGWCEDSTFINKTTPSSPFINDCIAIVHRMRQLKQTWSVPRGISGYMRLYAYGTCEFGAKGSFLNVKFGNDDVADLVEDSVRKFGWFDKVGAEGTLRCVVHNGKNLSQGRWALYHT